jgi:glycosyltransferase involved in cell wall biosynthesis
MCSFRYATIIDMKLHLFQRSLKQICGDAIWRLLWDCDRFLNILLPRNSRRRSLCDRFTSLLEIVINDGVRSFWKQVSHILREFPLSTFLKGTGKRNEREEMPDNRRRLMVVIGAMEVGGVERCTAVLLERLDRALINAELVTVFNREIFYPLSNCMKLTVLEDQLYLSLPTDRPLIPDDLQTYARELDWLEMTALKLAMIIRNRRSSVILAQDYWMSIIALLAKRHVPPTVKVIVTMHCFPSGILPLEKNAKLLAFLIKDLFKNADGVITVSEGISLDLMKNFQVPPEKIRTIYNPLNFEQMQKQAYEPITEHAWFDEDVPFVLFVGRLSQVKGLDYLLRAFSKIREVMSVRCVLVGDGAEMAGLKYMADRLGIGYDVLFLGEQKNPFKFMRKAAVFVLPSLFEGLPNVLIEALFCGCPVIAADCHGGGVREILQRGECGLLVPPEDEKALSAAILRLLTDKSLRLKFSEVGMHRARDFNSAYSVREYENIILRN